MNILLTIHHHLDPNTGAPGATYQLASEYKKLEHQVQIHSFDDLPGWIPEKVKAIAFPYSTARSINHSLRKQRIDVVDSSSGDPWLWAVARRKPHSPYSPLLVTRSHGLEHIAHLGVLDEARRENLHLSWKYPLYHGGIHLWEVATSFRRADLALFLNRGELRYAVQKLGVKPDRARVVANGIPSIFLNLPFEATPAKDEPDRIVQVGGYIAIKGIKYAAPALNAVLTRHPQTQVTFLGTGCSAEQVLADYDPPVRGRIKVLPRYPRAELPSLLSGHHIKLLPSPSEGFGVAVLEAMACGLAPVVTSALDSAGVVRDGHNALVVPTRDSRAIERALERLLVNRTLLARLRHNARAEAQAYSWGRIAQQTLNLYEEFLQKRRTR